MNEFENDLGAQPYIIREMVARALVEDVGPADATSQAVIAGTVRGAGQFVGKEPGVLAGIAAARECFV